MPNLSLSLMASQFYHPNHKPQQSILWPENNQKCSDQLSTRVQFVWLTFSPLSQFSFCPDLFNTYISLNTHVLLKDNFHSFIAVNFYLYFLAQETFYAVILTKIYLKIESFEVTAKNIFSIKFQTSFTKNKSHLTLSSDWEVFQ